MTKSNSSDYHGSVSDDSGIGTDLRHSSSSLALIESSSSSYIPQPTVSVLSFPTTAVIKERSTARPLRTLMSDGIIQRVRPATMKNSENGDYILCQTDRGAYIAYRSTIVPEWVRQLVEEIESQEE